MTLKGSIHRGILNSKILEGNPAGEDAERPITVYVPAGSSDQFPVIYYLPGWLGAGRTMADWRPFKESLPERFERLIEEKRMPPCILVGVDLYTSYGGSQYINSEFFGAHADHIISELFPYIEKSFPVKKGAKHRAVFGKSSGGFGAMRLAMDHPGEIAAIACHSGDMGFDVMFGGEYVDLCNHLHRHRDNPKLFYEYAQVADKLSGKDMHVLMLLGNAGFYSPDLKEPAGYVLPIDLYSGELNAAVVSTWKKQDPLERVNTSKEALNGLKCLYLECGTRDQYNLLYGARQLHAKLEKARIDHHYFEFDDDHSGVDYRYDVSLPMIAEAIA